MESSCSIKYYYRVFSIEFSFFYFDVWLSIPFRIDNWLESKCFNNMSSFFISSVPAIYNSELIIESNSPTLVFCPWLTDELCKILDIL